ncbi:MAG TPA: hypothetical protein VFV98_20020 [Vicinamibacterales bacterium]|nr:hypothetical protein [Vicinamibacterales bacterium]
MLRLGIVLLVLAAAATPALSQTTSTPRLRVFLDCGSCSQDYLRDQIKWVDFVRQPQDADVHILDNSNSTGGGGREVVVRFVGNGRFQAVDRELRVVTQVADTDQRQRELMLRTISVGLLEYIAREGLPPELEVQVTTPAAAGRPAAVVSDPWNRWVFSIGGGGEYQDQETQREVNWRGNASADRVTDAWKISFGVNGNERRERFELDDEDEPLEVTRRDRRFEWFVAKSAGQHWSFGADGRVGTSTFSNLGFSVRAAPAVEFSIFPYRDYASERWVIKYDAGIEKNRYNEITLYGQEQETLWRHSLESVVEAEQPWGSIEAGVEFSQYLHDRSLYRVEVNGETSIRIARGLSFELSASISRVRDQITLPRRDATDEEILLRLRELQSGYNVFTFFGIRYSFGSLFNNVVNPRFR